ncbi:MAG: APC family permease [Candidatus Stahlbacteria bacterium]|nr:APC family permease [Candidatus Stahlbacteria bacterium]
MDNTSFTQKTKRFLLGEPRDLRDKKLFHKLSLIAFFAWVGFGIDGITSSCYGPAEAYIALGKHSWLSLFLAIMTALTVFIISSSYKQIIELFPNGGGGYIVASKLLSPTLGMVSGCALLIDYVLTIAVSVAAGTEAVFSFLPYNLQGYKILFSVLLILVLTTMNLRGVKESIVAVTPMFIIFILTHTFIILYAFITHFGNMPTIVNHSMQDFSNTTSQIGWMGALFILLHAYSLGGGTYTGIEAVSNGMPLIREPRVQEAKKTMTLMAISLAFMAGGLILAYLFYNVEPVHGKTLNAVLFESIAGGWRFGNIFVIVALLSSAILLLVAAQTGFLDGPRVLANMAADFWVPSRFTLLSERLVTQNGIILMGLSAIILILGAKNSVAFLVVLYSINVFLTFSLSQMGMIRHWWKNRKSQIGWLKRFAINGIGLLLTGFILITVIVVKFFDGGWLTILVTSLLVIFSLYIKNQYLTTRKQLKRLDDLTKAAYSDEKSLETRNVMEYEEAKYKETAIILVNGFNGIGLHTLFGVIKAFKNYFKNFVFLQVGVVDTGIFKGQETLEDLQNSIQEDLSKYVNFMRKENLYSDYQMSIGTDVVDEVENNIDTLIKKYPNSKIFAGQLLFKDETIITRLLHNYTAFAVERRLYHKGIPVFVMPIRVDL